MKGKFKKLIFTFAACTIIGAINVNAAEMSDKFKEVFPAGKMVIKSIAPKSMGEAWHIIAEDNLQDHEGFSLVSDSCNSTYTKCQVCYNRDLPGEEIHEIDFEYRYDEKIKTIVDNYLKKIPTGQNAFSVKDLEIINYWVNDGTSIINYSGELKSYIDNKNFSIDLRAGGGTDFTDSGFGVGKFSYNDTVYYINSFIGAIAKQAIYVPDNTELDKDVLMNTAQARIDNYIGAGKVRLEYVGIIEDWLESIDQEYYDYHQEEYNNEEGELHFLQDAAGGYYYKAVIGEKEYYLVIIRSTEDMLTPKYVSSDLNSDITISSDKGIIPLDTLIRANKLTSGTDFEKINKILNLSNSEIFDLKLYSNSLKDYFTKLDNGTFEVKIPLSDQFKDKKLIAYYVDADGKKTAYNVKVESGFAIFNTNHFSIYTLAENTLENPQTYDKATTFIILGSISATGLLSCSLYFNKKQKLNNI